MPSENERLLLLTLPVAFHDSRPLKLLHIVLLLVQMVQGKKRGKSANTRMQRERERERKEEEDTDM